MKSNPEAYDGQRIASIPHFLLFLKQKEALGSNRKKTSKIGVKKSLRDYKSAKESRTAMIDGATHSEKPSSLIANKLELRAKLASNKRHQRSFDHLVAKLESGNYGAVEGLSLKLDFMILLARDLDLYLGARLLSKDLAEKHYQGIMKAIQNLSDKIDFYRSEAPRNGTVFQIENVQIEENAKSQDVNLGE